MQPATPNSFRAALVQMCSGRDVARNLRDATALIREAASGGADYVQTPEATNQKASGRCWLFAGLNTLRLKAMQRLGLESFELSQAYLMFWDKVEKANYFYENILATLDEPLDGRLLMWLLAQPLSDAGQWDMLVNLIEKYGVVPKAVMPESFSSSASAHMNGVLTARLRADARQLRAAYDRGKMHALVVVAEGATNNAERLIAHFESEPEATGFRLRATILGHVQRGANPTAADRLLGTRLGEGAVRALQAGQTGVLTGLRGNRVVTTPLEEIVGRQKPIDLELFELANIMAR